ncbi:hnh endonuclease family protein [hydrocarbon metagenome]|uniref:Hnh endonuclease family protein n=1 Tax=hydrocarbon metagenome TaxID=938273 RepID=A0A0W8FW04_9ZZZZ
MPCNNKKGDRTPEEAMMKLRVKPYTPNHIMYIKNSTGRLEEKWKPFLFH